MHVLAAAFACLTVAAAPAAAQVFAIDAPMTLKVVGDTDELVVFAQVETDGRPPSRNPHDAWVWTFMADQQGGTDVPWDTVAVLTRFDCRAGTRQRLRYEFYLDEMAMNDAPYTETPSAPPAGSIDEQVMTVVCNPVVSPDYPVVPRPRGIRASVDGYFASLR